MRLNNQEPTNFWEIISSRTFLSPLLVIVGIGLALALRFSLFSFISRDFTVFIGPWFTYLKSHGLFGLADNFSEYTPPYLYLLYIASIAFSKLNDVTAIKLLAVFGDLICAYYVYKIVLIKYNRGPFPMLAFFTILFTPTVVLNGSCWGQADIFYTTALIASIYYLLTEHETTAFVALGISISFKLQGAFLVPLFIALAFKRQVNWKNFFYIPYIYLISILPAWILGRSFVDLLTIYVQQAGTYQELTMNAPNMYVWFPNDKFETLLVSGLIFAVSIIFLLVFLVYNSPKDITNPLMVRLACISVLVMPYILPKMHDRFFFPADILSIVFAYYFPRYWWAAFIIIMASFSSYLFFLFGKVILPSEYFALLLLIVIVLLIRNLIINLFSLEKSAYDD